MEGRRCGSIFYPLRPRSVRRDDLIVAMKCGQLRAWYRSWVYENVPTISPHS